MSESAGLNGMQIQMKERTSKRRKQIRLVLLQKLGTATHIDLVSI